MVIIVQTLTMGMSSRARQEKRGAFGDSSEASCDRIVALTHDPHINRKHHDLGVKGEGRLMVGSGSVGPQICRYLANVKLH